jgi:hypothetical protein
MKFLAPFLLIASSSASSTHHVMEKLSSSPRLWKAVSPSEPTSMIDLTFFVRIPSSTLSNLEGEFLARSDPTNQKFGRWMSNDEVQAMASPSSASVTAVYDYIESLGGGLQVRSDFCRTRCTARRTKSLPRIVLASGKRRCFFSTVESFRTATSQPSHEP